MSRSLYTAWLERDPATLKLIGADAREATSRRAAVERAATTTLAPALLEELRRQQAELPVDSARAAALERLSRPGTVAVITGQQVGLFLGPLYTFYKAATALRAARALEEETGVPCVALFWLQTEDHDFAEIDHCEVPAADQEAEREESAPAAVRLKLGEAGEDRIPVGHRKLDDSVRACVQQLEGLLEGLPEAPEVMATVRRHYQPGRSLSAAFAGLLAELFAGDGLLIFDPRRPAISALWAPMLEHALLDEQRITFLLEERCAAIQAAGFQPQVHVRHGSPLVFVHPDGAQGRRYRVDRQEDGRYLLVGTERLLTRDQLFTLARRDPFSLSSSALLRPILQDALFPTAAYVGGPGELGYAAQLGPLYRHFGMAPTLFLPRAGFRLIDTRTRRALEALGLTPAEAAQPAEVLLERQQLSGAGGHPSAEELERALLEPVQAALAQAAGTATRLDPQLERAVQRTRATMERAAARFAGRYRRARLERSGVARQRILRIQRALFPDGAPQERRFAWPSYAATFGVRALHDRVLTAIDPFQPGTRDLLP